MMSCLKSEKLFQSFLLLQVVYCKTIMRSCSKGNDTFEEVIIRKVKPLFGNINIDGSSAVVTALVPGFIKFGFIGSIIFLIEAVP